MLFWDEEGCQARASDTIANMPLPNMYLAVAA